MTSRVKWGEWREQRRGLARLGVEVPRSRGGRARVRDAEDREMITRVMLAELQRWEREGRLVRVGPRRVRFGRRAKSVDI